MNVDVSPDGEAIVFDLLGDLYLIPSGGGAAVPLTMGTAWDKGPRFSPDGDHVYFVSDREGYKNLWRVSLDDKSVEQITRLDRNILGTVTWSQDHSLLTAGIAGRDFSTSSEVLLNAIDPSSGVAVSIERWTGPSFRRGSSGAIERLRSRKSIFSGTGGGAEDSVFFSEAESREMPGGDFRRRSWIYRVDPETQTREYLTHEDAEYSDFKPQLSHDGRRLVYLRQYDDRRTELRVLDRESGQDQVITTLDNVDDILSSLVDVYYPNYAFTPNDEALVYWHAGKIWRVGLDDGIAEVIPFTVQVERDVAPRAEPPPQTIRAVEEANTIRWPSLSLDGKTMAFAAAGYVWVMDTASGDTRRLTSADEFAFMPAVSPDGSSVAYIAYPSDQVPSSWLDYGIGQWKAFGRLMVADTNVRTYREVLSEPDTKFALPRWSGDGTKIAVLRRATVGTREERTVGWTNASGGGFNAVNDLPDQFPDWVGFDRAGEHLLFSYRISRGKPVVAMANLAGEGFRILAIGASDVDWMHPSPDLTQLVLTRRDRTLWLTPFAVEPEPKAVSTFALEVSPLSKNGGFFVDWYDDQRLSYGFGQWVFDYDMATQRLQSRHVRVPITRPVPGAPLAFTGARIITLADGSEAERIMDNGVLIIDRGRITAVGQAGGVTIPDDAVVIDVTGKTIVPGFIDSHYHAAMGSYQSPSQYWNETTAIEYGVTTAWHPNAGRLFDLAAAHVDLHTAGRVVGPRWSYTSSGAGHPHLLLLNENAALANAERQKGLGATVVKEYSVPTRAQQRWISNAVRYHNLGVVSHIDQFEGTMTRAIDGYTGADHQFFSVPFFEDMHQLLAKTGFIWTPNINTTYGSLTTLIPFGMQPARAYLCRAAQRGQARGELGELNLPPDCENVDANLPLSFEDHRLGRMAKQAAEAVSRGVKMGVSGHDAPAFNLHISMWAHWRGGMPAEDVLRSASLVNAEKLGLQHEIGSLEVGKVADFVVLDANPLDNMLNTMSVEYTVQFGRIYDADSAAQITAQNLQRRHAGERAANDDDMYLPKTRTGD